MQKHATQQNTALAEQSAASAASVEAQASGLQQAVALLRLPGSTTTIQSERICM